MKNRTLDPIFLIVLTNTSDDPVTLNAIGIQPIAAWDAFKGSPCVIKLREFEAVTLKVNGFDPGKAQLVRLSNPVSIGVHGSYRIKFRLVNYNKAVGRNESGIQVVAEANQRRIISDPLYLGLCDIQECD